MKLLIAILPIVFMIHDFEEIIMSKAWLTKNREELKRRFPKMERFMVKNNLFYFSTSAFAVAVMHEFLLISAATFVSLYFDNYSVWFAAFMAYFIHLFMHIGQWALFRKYVPVIITSILTMPYCIYTFFRFIRFTEMTVGELLLWSFAGIVAAVLSFFPAFYLAKRFHRWKTNRYDKKELNTSN